MRRKNARWLWVQEEYVNLRIGRKPGDTERTNERTWDQSSFCPRQRFCPTSSNGSSSLVKTTDETVNGKHGLFEVHLALFPPLDVASHAFHPGYSAHSHGRPPVRWPLSTRATHNTMNFPGEYLRTKKGNTITPFRTQPRLQAPA